MQNLTDLRVQIAPRHPGGLKLDNPVMAASGTFGYGTEFGDSVDIQQLGAIICKGITLRPTKGNRQPRIVETMSGLLNSVGLENIGVEALIKDKAPTWAAWQVPVIVNVAGETVDEYVQTVSRLEGIPGIRAVELNVSCPNVPAGGMEFGVNAELAARLTGEVKAVSSLPIMVKLSPNVTDIRGIALAVEKAGADAVSLINTVKAMAIDAKTRKPCLGNIAGGLSGPAIKPIALYMVYQVAEVISIPVIGCGGISSATDALEFIMAGASAVQVGTLNLTGPEGCVAVVTGIRDFMGREGIAELSDLVGIAH